MTDNVIPWKGHTKLDLLANTVLENALSEGLTEVVIIGFDKDGKEFFAASKADLSEVLWHLQRSIHRIMKEVDERIERN